MPSLTVSGRWMNGETTHMFRPQISQLPPSEPARAAGAYVTWRLVPVALALVSATVLSAAAPASAGAVPPAGQIDRTAGIKPAAHSVTLHNGTVLTGITIVDERDVLRVRRQQAGSATRQVTTAVNLQCLSEWHFVTAGGANTYWKPAPYSKYLYANGNRGADYWNQEFLPCWESGWELNAWAFLSNATGQFVDWLEATLFLVAQIPSSWDDPEFTDRTKFQVCDYDGNWMYMQKTLPNTLAHIWAARNPANGGVVESDGPLNGNSLFKVDPWIWGSRC
jgi:hypothetical protein